MILYRPVGLAELELIAATAYRAFPPRSELQPILYAVLDQRFAAQTAYDWNANDPESGYAGFVIRFAIDDGFALRYTLHDVGSGEYREVWIPSEDITELNTHLIGPMQVVDEFYGRRFAGPPLALVPPQAGTQEAGGAS
jgi:hypothetical protein